MTRRDLITVRIDRRELELIREGLIRVAKDREFTIKVQPASSQPAIAATDSLGILRALQGQLDEIE